MNLGKGLDIYVLDGPMKGQTIQGVRHFVPYNEHTAKGLKALKMVVEGDGIRDYMKHFIAAEENFV